MDRQSIAVPAAVHDGILACREAGEHNMLDHLATVAWCTLYDYDEAAEWCYLHRAEYGAGILGGFVVEESE